MIAVAPSLETRSVEELRVKLFADGADKAAIVKLCANPHIAGFTTNPTLMRKAGVSDFEAFAKDVLTVVRDRSISFEVFADEWSEMRRQARLIASWGDNIYVKIPVTNTRGESAKALIADLSADGVKLNVTALTTLEQVDAVCDALADTTPAYVSVFAGRVADTGRDPMPLMRDAAQRVHERANTELIWASPRELLNVFQADDVDCDIITATPDILAKLSLVGKDLTAYSLDTVRMFFDDARSAGYSL
jgi:transaldolase